MSKKYTLLITWRRGVDKQRRRIDIVSKIKKGLDTTPMNLYF